MNTRRLRHLALVAVAIVVLNQSYSGINNRVQASFQNELAWVTFAPEGEEFTAMVPGWPTVRYWPSSNYSYDEARAHRIVGTVILEAIFAEDGYVANISVTKGLKDGLTENAIEAARNIKFFPAEKDGKPVSQRMMLEYNFALY